MVMTLIQNIKFKVMSILNRYRITRKRGLFIGSETLNYMDINFELVPLVNRSLFNSHHSRQFIPYDPYELVLYNQGAINDGPLWHVIGSIRYPQVIPRIIKPSIRHKSIISVFDFRWREFFNFNFGFELMAQKVAEYNFSGVLGIMSKYFSGSPLKNFWDTISFNARNMHIYVSLVVENHLVW